MRRNLILGLVIAAVLLAVGCTNKKSTNPLSNVGSKQPDKVLFDRSMDAMKHNHFDVARMTLQTLINTYPDSEYVARAKLAVADSWYAEGGTTALQQAEIQYKDFKTFFPNMPEAAEAQLKVADIHYQQMEKPDRDFTHAERAEEEYRALIQEYPDSKLVPKARQRLREVQEVLAQREFNVGQFYFLRLAYPAAIARLKTLVDRYPLYSGADQALFMLGRSYEGEIELIRKNPRTDEVSKTRMIEKLTKDAADAYSRIITRYPAMDRAVDAKARLEAMHQNVPRPTRKMLEQNKREEASRQESTLLAKGIGNFAKGPDTSKAAHFGDPSMVDPEPETATNFVSGVALAASGGGGGGKLNAAILNGPVGPNQEAPRSDNSTATTDATANQAATGQPATANAGTAPAPAANELTPSVADPNELKPNVDQDANSLPPLQQNNELANGLAAGASKNASSSSSTSSSKDELADISSSKKKKKKGIAKLNPF
ncbi:MAG: outer membrane protein assembly factor BamD [Terriglobales bacterium]